MQRPVVQIPDWNGCLRLFPISSSPAPPHSHFLYPISPPPQRLPCFPPLSIPRFVPPSASCLTLARSLTRPSKGPVARRYVCYHLMLHVQSTRPSQLHSSLSSWIVMHSCDCAEGLRCVRQQGPCPEGMCC